MVIVYVKHYLNNEGIKFFQKWFHDLSKIIKLWEGFSNAKYSFDIEDHSCINLFFEFNSERQLKEWRASDEHTKIVMQLEQYRVKPYDVMRFNIVDSFKCEV